MGGQVTGYGLESSFPDCLRILEQPIVVAVCNVLPWNPPLLECGRILEHQEEEELDDFIQGVCL
jgi:hypothetical protein